VAGRYTSVIVYGDSLSDNGNSFTATSRPCAPYWKGYRSDGYLAVKDLATKVGAPCSTLPGLGPLPELATPPMAARRPRSEKLSLPGIETAFTASQASVAPTSLFVIWGGANDFLSPAPEDGGDPLKTANRAVADLMSIVTGVEGLGAQHILVPGMPDLGSRPTSRVSAKAPPARF